MQFTLIPRAQVAEVLESAPQPAGGLPAKYIVTLTVEERAQLQALTQAGRIAARTLKHAWILLKADASPAGPAWSDSAIRTASDVGWSTIARVRPNPWVPVQIIHPLGEDLRENPRIRGSPRACRDAPPTPAGWAPSVAAPGPAGGGALGPRAAAPRPPAGPPPSTSARRRQPDAV